MNINRNDSGNDYIIGDLHGHMDLLTAKLEKINFDKKKDRLFSTGDLIDRGPRSLDCLLLVFEPWFFAVRGNHEQMMLDSLIGMDNRSLDLWMMNGGNWLHENNLQLIREVAIKAKDKMPLWMTIDSGDSKIGIVHAEPPLDWNIIDQHKEQELIWSRDKINKKKEDLVANIDMVYVGHTPVETPLNLGNTRYIDTGAFYTGNLTMEKLI